MDPYILYAAAVAVSIYLNITFLVSYRKVVQVNSDIYAFKEENKEPDGKFNSDHIYVILIYWYDLILGIIGLFTVYWWLMIIMFVVGVFEQKSPKLVLLAASLPVFIYSYVLFDIIYNLK